MNTMIIGCASAQMGIKHSGYSLTVLDRDPSAAVQNFGRGGYPRAVRIGVNLGIYGSMVSMFLCNLPRSNNAFFKIRDIQWQVRYVGPLVGLSITGSKLSFETMRPASITRLPSAEYPL